MEHSFFRRHREGSFSSPSADEDISVQLVVASMPIAFEEDIADWGLSRTRG